MNLGNYLPDVNRFSLAAPPQWWLHKLWDFDPSLVVVPSRQGFMYRLAQRRKLKLPAKMVNDILFNESDTQMLASYSLIPVTTIIATVNWSDPLLFVELHNRAPHRLGGAEKVIPQLEMNEQMADLRRKAETDEMLTFQAKDAWGLYNKKIGVRSHSYIPKTKGPKAIVGRSPAVRIT